MAEGSAAALPKLLRDIDAAGYKLVSLHDRPAKTLLGEYVFVIELAGDGRREALAEVLAKHSGSMKSRLLGSFDIK